jgi:hypothetical protein
MLIITGSVAVCTNTLLLHHSSSAQSSITLPNSSLLCCQMQHSTGIGNITMNTTLIKDNYYSSGLGDVRYILNPANTFIHLSNYPNLHYVISRDGKAWLSVFTDGDVYLNAHLKIQTDRSAQTYKSTIQGIDVTAFTRYDLLHHLFSPIMGTTTYDTEPGFLSIGDNQILWWSNAKVKLKTFDNGIGTFSLAA